MTRTWTTAMVLDPGNYHTWDLVWTGTFFDVYKDTALMKHKTDYIPTVPLYPGFSSRVFANALLYVDIIYVYKYVVTKPTYTTGQEEHTRKGNIIIF